MRYLTSAVAAAVGLILVIGGAKPVMAQLPCIYGTIYYDDCTQYTPGDHVDYYYKAQPGDQGNWYAWSVIGYDPGAHEYHYSLACPIPVGCYFLSFTIQDAHCNPQPVQCYYFDGEHPIVKHVRCCSGTPESPQDP